MEHIEFTKKLTGHEFSNMLDDLETGDRATIKGPFGKMTFDKENEKIALISGGIGITPMISICKYCTDMKVTTDIILISSNRTEEDLIFLQELDDMKKVNKNLKLLNTLTRASDEWKGYRERICEDLIRREVPDYEQRFFYVCGPPPMVNAMVEMLHGLKVPDSRIKKEALIGY